MCRARRSCPTRRQRLSRRVWMSWTRLLVTISWLCPTCWNPQFTCTTMRSVFLTTATFFAIDIKFWGNKQKYIFLYFCHNSNQNIFQKRDDARRVLWPCLSTHSEIFVTGKFYKPAMTSRWFPSIAITFWTTISMARTFVRATHNVDKAFAPQNSISIRVEKIALIVRSLGVLSSGYFSWYMFCHEKIAILAQCVVFSRWKCKFNQCSNIQAAFLQS